MGVDYTTLDVSIPSQDGAFFSVKMPMDVIQNFANINLHFTNTVRTLNLDRLHYMVYCSR